MKKALMAIVLFLSLEGCKTKPHFIGLSNPDLIKIAKSGEIRVISEPVNNRLNDSSYLSLIEREGFIQRFASNNQESLYQDKFEINFSNDSIEVDFPLDSTPFIATHLYQEYNGVKIIDRKQIGIFNAETGAPRLLQLNLINPKHLKNITIPKVSDNTIMVLKKFLKDKNLNSVSDPTLGSLFISSSLGFAGFFTSFKTGAETNVEYISALVNPETQEVRIIERFIVN